MDPQLHTHVVIPNRVLAPDGRWLALDARTVKVDQRTLSALYHASLRAELTRSLAVTWHEPANGIAEMTAVAPSLLREFSQRSDAVAERQSTWRPAELVRELAAAVPSDVRVSADKLVPWLDDLAAEVIDERLVDLSRPVPDDVLLRRDGRPVSEAVTDRALTTPDILAEEEAVIAWAAKRLEARGAHNAAVLEAASALSEPQLELAAAVAGTGELVLGVGPAGSGKTAAPAPAVEQLRIDGRAIFGAPPSAPPADGRATRA